MMEAERNEHRQRGFPARTLAGLGCGLILVCGSAVATLAPEDPLDRVERIGERTTVPLSVANPTLLPFAKPPGELRVFVIGASQTYGLPYRPEAVASYARLCEAGLRAVLGRRDLHIRPEARPAWDSEQCAAMATQLLRWQPDLCVLVLGTNEWANRVVHGRDLVPSGPVARLGDWLSRSRLLLERFGAGPRAGTKAGRPGGFDAVVRSARPGRPAVAGLPIPEADRALILEAMRARLRGLGAACAAAGTRLALVTGPRSFERNPPWCNDLDGPDPEVDALVVEVRERPRPGLMAEVDRLRAAHPSRGDLCWAKARLLASAGAAAEALRLYELALDLDLAPLHQTTGIRRALADMAVELGVPMWDLDSALAGTDGLPDPAIFLDYSHTDLEGHRRLARWLARRLDELGLVTLPEDWRPGFDAAVEARIAAQVQPQSIRDAAGEIAHNDGVYYLLFGNYRDALPHLAQAWNELGRSSTRDFLVRCRAGLGLPAEEGR